MNKSDPFVSVIVPTKNSQAYLGACLESIRNQTYKNYEIIVVDNYSTDETEKIAKKYQAKFYSQGPERSAQVNYGVEKCSGQFVYKVDSDFTLDKDILRQCVDKVKDGYKAVVVHNSPDVNVSWIAKIRKFEVDMYKYDLTHSSARFVDKKVYQDIGGFNSAVTAGEDYDFQNKLNRAGVESAFIEAEAIHHGEPTNIWKHLTKYYTYGKDFINYSENNKSETSTQLGFLRNVYIKNWTKFLKHPLLGSGFLVYNCFKYFFGGLGFAVAKLNTKSNQNEA